tara:strand:- start:50 stop:376 length:327 start_codon:yes stop_codon:yes gene_type:complete
MKLIYNRINIYNLQFFNLIFLIMSEILKSKRFFIRKSLVGKNQVIEVTFKSGTVQKYNHDEVYEVMKSKLEAMPCFIKYKSYTSSSSIPVIARELIIKDEVKANKKKK